MAAAWEALEFASKRIMLGVLMAPDARVSWNWCMLMRHLDTPPGSLVQAMVGLPFHVARNVLAQYAHQQHFQGIFFLDADTIPPTDVVSRLVATGRDFIGGLYYRRQPPYTPTAGILVAQPDGKLMAGPLPPHQDGDIIPVDFLPTGCTYISWQCLDALFRKHPRPFDWGHDIAQVPDGEGGYLPQWSEDFIFSFRAKSLGFTPWLHTGIQCEHEVMTVVKRGEAVPQVREAVLTGGG